jgi:hypothetical protein
MQPKTNKAQAMTMRADGDALRNHKVRRARAECELVQM